MDTGDRSWPGACVRRQGQLTGSLAGHGEDTALNSECDEKLLQCFEGSEELRWPTLLGARSWLNFSTILSSSLGSTMMGLHWGRGTTVNVTQMWAWVVVTVLIQTSPTV